MDFGSAIGERQYAALLRAADHLVIGLDFDGTLSPIVEDPKSAHIHPEAGEVLVSDVARQLAFGSGLTFERRRRVKLRGLPGSWVLSALVS